MAVSLAAEDSSELDPAAPGQFVVVRAFGKPSQAAMVRSYSLTRGTEMGRYEIAVKCEVDGAMGTYFAAIARRGDAIEVSAPRGSFVLRESERPAVFMSAGIGTTPVLAMLEALAAARSQRTVWWIYGARSGADHPFADDVRALLSALPHGQSHICYSHPAQSDLLGRNFDAVGHVSPALVKELAISLESEFYLCGPPGFMRDLPAGLAEAGVPPDRIYSEVFGSGPAFKPGIVGGRAAAPHPPAGPDGTGPTVSFVRSGLNVKWNPRYASLLEFAEACDVPTRWSCRSGVCHTCECGVVSGEVVYDPLPLQLPAPGNLLPCCSVPKAEVVLDL